MKKKIFWFFSTKNKKNVEKFKKFLKKYAKTPQSLLIN